MPVAAMAQGSPFDTGFNAIQALFTGTIAKVASLVAIAIGGCGFAHGGANEGPSVMRSASRELDIEGQNSESSIIRSRSDLSRFSRGTVPPTYPYRDLRDPGIGPNFQ